MATDTSKLPKTKSRVSTSLRITAINPQGQEITIGAVQKLSRTISRSTTRRREFDSDIPGVTVELIPNPPGTISISIDRAVLYKSDMLAAFGFSNVVDLIEQNIPITIREYQLAPTGLAQTADNNVQTKIIEYRDCYFTANPITYDLTRDLVMIQTATLDVTTVVVRS